MYTGSYSSLRKNELTFRMSCDTFKQWKLTILELYGFCVHTQMLSIEKSQDILHTHITDLTSSIDCSYTMQAAQSQLELIIF